MTYSKAHTGGNEKLRKQSTRTVGLEFVIAYLTCTGPQLLLWKTRNYSLGTNRVLSSNYS
jgi:hypothetical protein